MEENTYVPVLEEPIYEGAPSKEVGMSELVVTPSGELRQLQENTAVIFTLHIRPHYSAATIEPLVYVVADEPFLLEISEGEYVIKHENWSLRVRGASLIEAEMDLIKTAQIIAPTYLNRPVGKMTLRALELKDFIIRVI